MYFFSGDEHYFHKNVIKYCNRPFVDLDEMHKTLISNHNKVVTRHDTTIHAGDFFFGHKEAVSSIIQQLNGNHIFLMGCHDRWLKKSAPHIKKFKINKTLIMVCHYPLSSWFASSHVNSISLHAHSHGKMMPIKNRLEIGVDANNFTPLSEKEIFEKIKIQNAMLDTLSGQCCFDTKLYKEN